MLYYRREKEKERYIYGTLPVPKRRRGQESQKRSRVPAQRNLPRFHAVRSAAAVKTRGKREGGEVFASIAREKDRNKEKTEA